MSIHAYNAAGHQVTSGDAVVVSAVDIGNKQEGYKMLGLSHGGGIPQAPLIAAVILCSTMLLLEASVTEVTKGSLLKMLDNNVLVFVNFYVDWCHFSDLMQPIFEEASDRVAKLHPEDPEEVAFAKVNCETSEAVCSHYKIMKYPTLKVFHFGEMAWHEYRGQRSAEAMVLYIQAHFKYPFIEKPTVAEVESIREDIGLMLVYIENKASVNYRVIQEAASQLRTDCTWMLVAGDNSKEKRQSGDIVYFRPEMAIGKDEMFTDFTNKSAFKEFCMQRCLPKVQELTFANAEELSEDDIPFLILFRRPDDHSTKALFKEAVQREMPNDKGSLMFLIADGITFLNPLKHMGKTISDLPVLAIDNFRNMFPYSLDVRKCLSTPGALQIFIGDFLVGRLLKEYQAMDWASKQSLNSSQEGSQLGRSKVLESRFKLLKPAHNRYTLLKDEL